jgi:hypothetical protein
MAKNLSFYADSNRSGNTLKIETDGCVVYLEVGQADDQGRPVTAVSVNPDGERYADAHWGILAPKHPGTVRVVKYGRKSGPGSEGTAPNAEAFDPADAQRRLNQVIERIAYAHPRAAKDPKLGSMLACLQDELTAAQWILDGRTGE